MSDEVSRKKSIQKATHKAQKENLHEVQRHIFICCDTRETGCAGKGEMKDAWKHLKQRLKQRGLAKDGQCIANRSDCFDICRAGPIAVVYPDGVWYGNCRPEVLDRIVDEHVIGGRVVEEFVIAGHPAADATAKG